MLSGGGTRRFPRTSIGVPRFELGTSPTRTERATRLRHTPRPKQGSAFGGAAGRPRLESLRGAPGRHRAVRGRAARGASLPGVRAAGAAGGRRGGGAKDRLRRLLLA